MRPLLQGQALKYLGPAWFAPVMGLAGLALAWHRARGLMGPAAEAAAWLFGSAGALLCLVLLFLSLARARRFPGAWVDDLRHPVRHAFVAALPVALILLSTVAAALGGAHAWVSPLWMVACSVQLGVTVWVLGRLLRARSDFPWAAMTPLMYIPVVGNVLAPLAGMNLGHGTWASMQFALGALLWPLLTVTLFVRLARQGWWPERLRATVFISLAPPSALGLGLDALGAPSWALWLCWGLALGFLLWSLRQLPQILNQAFTLPFWAASFPTAAFASLSLLLASPTGLGLMLPLAILSLALSNVIMLGLLLGSYRGLRDGSLLAPEPVAMLSVTSP